MSTPHNAAKVGDIAETVLLPGDPLRAKFIAETYLEDPVLYNTVRGMYGYTGTYKGKRISVQGTGMGIPSMGIYSYELIHVYGCKNLIRIGSAGGYGKLKVRDIVIAMGACTNSNYGSQFGLPGTFAPIASYELLENAVKVARDKNIPVSVGNILSSDCFYGDGGEDLMETKWSKMGVYAVEMETAGLYMNAARAGVNALAILTISDCPATGEATTAEERQETFTKMMEIALELA